MCCYSQQYIAGPVGGSGVAILWGGVGGLWWGTQGGTTDPPHYGGPGEVGPRPRGLRHGCALLPGETREPFAPLKVSSISAT